MGSEMCIRDREIAFRNRWITPEQLEALAAPLSKNGYGKYLQRLLVEKVY